MKKNRVIQAILAAAVIAIVGFTGIALASPHGGGRHMGYGNLDCPRYEEGQSRGWSAKPDARRSAHRFEMHHRIGHEDGYGSRYVRTHHGWSDRGFFRN
jgi:hypothetical protein